MFIIYNCFDHVDDLVILSSVPRFFGSRTIVCAQSHCCYSNMNVAYLTLP
jgi:hypothetical protein